MILPDLSLTKLRREALIYYRTIVLKDLQGAGRIRRDWEPRGQRMVNRMMLNYLKQHVVFEPDHKRIRSGDALVYGFAAMVERAAEESTFIEAYTVLNGLFVNAVAMKYPRLKEACDDQRVGDPIVDAEDLFRDVMDVSH